MWVLFSLAAEHRLLALVSAACPQGLCLPHCFLISTKPSSWREHVAAVMEGGIELSGRYQGRAGWLGK